MRFLNSPDALHADKDGCHDKSEAHDDRGNRLRLSMPIGVLLIGWLDRKLEPEKHDCGADHIGERFNAVGNQSKGVPQISGHTFQGCQRQIRADPDQRRPHDLVDCLFEWGGARIFRHDWSPFSRPTWLLPMRCFVSWPVITIRELLPDCPGYAPELGILLSISPAAHSQ